MKIITKSKDCFTCRNCCKFYENEEYFAPVFTDKEIKSLPKNLNKQTVFLSHKKSQSVYQVKLIASKSEKNILICPFFDEGKQLCGIYANRPFDCQLWPVILTRSRNAKKINITIAKKDYCMSIKKQHDNNRDKYFQYIVKYLNTAKIISFLKQYPDLVWGYESFTEKIGEINL